MNWETHVCWDVNQGNGTSQDFGCPFHELGTCEALLYPKEKEIIEIRAFLKERHGIILP